MTMDMCLPKLDVYQGTVLIFFQKKVFPDVRSEIHHVQHSVISPGQYVRD